MKFLILVLLALPCFAAPAATTVWEVRTTGSNTNGGGFNSAAAGTDMSIFDNKNATSCTSCQSATVNISVTDGVTAGTTTITSATANFSSAIVGNLIYVTGGTGSITANWYEVTGFTNSTTITVDRSTGLTTGTGVTINIGGALQTIAQGCNVNNGGNPGHIIYVKATATYSISATTACSANGAAGSPWQLVGYTTTRTDSGQVTVQATAGSLNLLTLSGQYLSVSNFIVNCNSQTVSTGILISGAYAYLYNITVQNCATRGIRVQGYTYITNAKVMGGLSGCTAGIGVEGRATITRTRITANACSGVSIIASSAVITRSIFDSNTGATTDGVQFAVASGQGGGLVQNCTFYANGRDGIRGTVAVPFDSIVIRNNLFISNTGNGITSTTTTYTFADMNYNGYYGNAASVSGVPAGANDVTLSGSPFTNAGAGDFSLNNTAGAGASARAAGSPGVIGPSGTTTGYLDLGAAQHQDSGGSGGTKSFGFVK